MYLEAKTDVFSGNLLVIRHVALWEDFRQSHFQVGSDDQAFGCSRVKADSQKLSVLRLVISHFSPLYWEPQRN